MQEEDDQDQPSDYHCRRKAQYLMRKFFLCGILGILGMLNLFVVFFVYSGYSWSFIVGRNMICGFVFVGVSKTTPVLCSLGELNHCHTGMCPSPKGPDLQGSSFLQNHGHQEFDEEIHARRRRPGPAIRLSVPTESYVFDEEVLHL